MIQQHQLPYQPASDYFLAIANQPQALWFDSAGSGRFDIICAQPLCSISLVDDCLTIESHHPSYTGVQGVFNDQQPKQLINAAAQWLQTQHPTENLPFIGGLAGSIDYDTFSTQRKVYQQTSDNVQAAMLEFGLYVWSLIIDHDQQQVTLVFLPECPDDIRHNIQQQLETIKFEANLTKDRVKDSVKKQESFKLEQPFQRTTAKQQYVDSVSKVLDYIHNGDCYQANYSQHFVAEYSGSPLDAYLFLRNQGSPFSAFMQHKKGAILCFSPERFISINGETRKIETWPIKGTRARSDNPEIDKNNAEALLNSTKDRAENVMIVDLLRNDLSINSKLHSVNVDKLFELHSYQYVHHLVSKISAERLDSSSAIDVIIDAFPGGSITGAPKRRSMQIINELETVPRHIYCGSICYFSCCGHVDSNITIRTFLADNQQQLHCWGGGGVVADSNAEQEYEESLHKVLPIMQSLEKQFLFKCAKDKK